MGCSPRMSAVYRVGYHRMRCMLRSLFLKPLHTALFTVSLKVGTSARQNSEESGGRGASACLERSESKDRHARFDRDGGCRLEMIDRVGFPRAGTFQVSFDERTSAFQNTRSRRRGYTGRQSDMLRVPHTTPHAAADERMPTSSWPGTPWPSSSVEERRRARA